MNKQFWKNKNVLITGFEGFLGSNLTKALIPFAANHIVGLDIKTFRKETILTARDYNKIKVIKDSVENYKLLENVIRKNKIDVVFHLAAEALVGRCHNIPLRAFSANIKGTWNILEACRKYGGVSSIIIASSDKAYGSHKTLPYTEEVSLIGKHPYDVSKSCADLIAHAYFHTYGLPAVITRCGNIYGPGDFNLSRIIPDATRSALAGKKLLIRSDGKFIRDYIFVEDIVYGYISLAEKTQKLKLGGEAFNFSDESPITVIELVKIIYKLAGEKADYRILNQARFEIRHQYLASAKARRILHWKPKASLDEGLRRTIAWYRQLLKR